MRTRVLVLALAVFLTAPVARAAVTCEYEGVDGDMKEMVDMIDAYGVMPSASGEVRFCVAVLDEGFRTAHVVSYRAIDDSQTIEYSPPGSDSVTMKLSTGSDGRCYYTRHHSGTTAELHVIQSPGGSYSLDTLVTRTSSNDAIAIRGRSDSSVTVVTANEDVHGQTGVVPSVKTAWSSGASAVSYSSAPVRIRHALIDNDDVPEIFFGASNGILVLDGTTGTPITTGNIPVDDVDGAVFSEFEVADFDGDGMVDVMLPSNAKSELIFLRGGLSGPEYTLTESSPIPLQNQVLRIAVGDMDGDADPDMIAIDGQGRILAILNDESQWTVRVVSSAAALGLENAIALPGLVDIDGDGDDDIVFAAATEGTSIYSLRWMSVASKCTDNDTNMFWVIVGLSIFGAVVLISMVAGAVYVAKTAERGDVTKNKDERVVVKKKKVVRKRQSLDLPFAHKQVLPGGAKGQGAGKNRPGSAHAVAGVSAAGAAATAAAAAGKGKHQSDNGSAQEPAPPRYSQMPPLPEGDAPEDWRVSTTSAASALSLEAAVPAVPRERGASGSGGRRKSSKSIKSKKSAAAMRSSAGRRTSAGRRGSQGRKAAMDGLVQLLARDDFAFVRALSECSHSVEIDDLARTVVEVFVSRPRFTEHARALANWAVQYNVSQTSSARDLFRSNSLSMRILMAFVRLDAGDWLRSTLGSVLQRVVQQPAAIDVIENPGLARTEAFTATVTELIDAIVGSVDNMAVGLPLVAHMMKQHVVAKFGKEAWRNSMADVMFVRLLSPAIANPVDHHVMGERGSVKLQPSHERVLVTLSKAVQAIGKGVVSFKEARMKELNKPLGQLVGKIGPMFDEMSSHITGTPEDVRRLARSVSSTVALDHLYAVVDEQTEALISLIDGYNVEMGGEGYLTELVTVFDVTGTIPQRRRRVISQQLGDRRSVMSFLRDS